MEIRIIETGEVRELIIIDPKTGCNWASDLTGNDENIRFDGEYKTCDMDTFDWWEDLIKRYQAADNRYYNMLTDLDDDVRDNLEVAVRGIAGCDLENYPEFLNGVLDEFLNGN